MSNLINRISSAFKTRSEAPGDINYKLAYESLKKQNETLLEENRDIKQTLDIISHVIDNVQRQNELLKEQVKILDTQNLRLEAENKVVKHNFIRKANASSKHMIVTRQVNN